MSIIADKSHVFSGLRALKSDAKKSDRDELFKNMGQLFAHVSNYCNDEQVTQYDEVLCQLAELVEKEARKHVANLLAPLERAPGSVVLHLANDDIDVARPLLEFSNVLSDDDLIDIIKTKSEEHRVAIAGREKVALRVGEAIGREGGQHSLAKLLENEGAEIDVKTYEKALHLASNNDEIAKRLRNRKNVDWNLLKKKISRAGSKVLAQLSLKEAENSNLEKISDVVYHRMRNKAGFSANEWKLAWNQVKALNDRRQLNALALTRFVRFGYGHHVAAALTMMMNISPEIFVKWLAAQDYVGITVACKTFNMNRELFKGVVSLLPWRDIPSEKEINNICTKFEKISKGEAEGIFKLWKEKSLKKNNNS